MTFLPKRISVAALSGYLAKESALFEDFIDTFQVHCECSHAQLLETLDPVRNYVDMPVLFEWWQHVIRPSQVYSHTLLQSAVGLFEAFYTTVRAHNISLGAVPDGLLSFQSDQGLSLKTVMTIFASSDCLTEQAETLDFVPSPQHLNAVKKRGHGFVLSELKNPIPLSPTHCKTSDHVRALMMSKLTAYKKDPNMTLEIKILRHFFALMDKTSDGNAALTDCEKMDLAQIVLAIPIDEWQEPTLSKLVLWTKEFKSNLGTSLTNALLTPASFRRHPNHGLLCDLFQTLIDSYPELSFESEIQGYARQSSARRRETPVTLADLYATVQQKKSDLLQKQAAEVSLETLIQRFSGIDAPEVDVPIAPAQLADIYQQVVELNQYCTQYARRPVHEIVPQLHTLSQGTETRNSMIEILAGIRLVMKDQFKQYAYDSQIMVVLGLLQHPDDFRGRLAQVKTGEGKSMIITMLSSYLGLRGKYVDVVTSADSLAIRDVEKYSAYYTLLGLSCGHVCERPYQASHFLPQILYGTVPDFSWAILYDHVSNTKYRLHPETQVARPFDCVIVDEVDNMLIDQIENRPIIGGTSRKQKDLKWIFIQITDFYLENKALYAQKREAFEAACIETLHTYASATGQRLDVPEFVLKLWCYLAHSAQSIKQEGRDYIIQKKLNPEVKGGIESKVTIVDWEHTGKIMENNVYTSGLNSFLEYKHRLPIKQRYCSLAELPQAVFFDFYTRILGVTGTMGSHAERKGLQEIYQLDSFDAPTYRPCLRETYAHHVCTTEPLFFETLADLAESVSNTQRPVLVLLMAISETNKLAKLLSMRGQDHQLYNGIQEQSETFVIAKAGHPRMITVATNTAGRGTDIILSRMSRAQGGLHVILGFFPANSRVEAQAFGRSSRQGQPGSWQFVICEEIEKERTRLFQDAPPASDMSSTDYFQTLYALREKSLLQEAKKRAISAKIQKEMFGYMHRFFAINTQIQHLNTKNTITLVGSFLSHCRYQKPDNLVLSSLEKEAAEDFLQLCPLTRDKTGGWLSSFLNEFSITILEDWASFFGNIHMLVEYLHSMTEDIDFLTLFQTIELESHRFFSVYQNSGNPLFFMGELLAKMGIHYNPEETKNKDWPPLLDALYQQNESLVTVLKGNGETYDSGIHKKGFSYLHGFLNIQDVATCKSLLQESNVKRMDMAYLEQNNDLTGVKPAHLAIKMGHLKIIQKMYILGFDFQSIWNKKSGLYLAVNHGHTAVVAYLLREKIGISDQYDSSLKLALTQSKHDIVSVLLQFRHPKNMPELVHFCYENQFTDSMGCLLEACTAQEKKKIRKLSVAGYPIIHHAVLFQKRDALKCFYLAGVDLNLPAEKQWTSPPIFYITTPENLSIFSHLIRDLNLRIDIRETCHGFNLLHYLALHQNHEGFQLLLETHVETVPAMMYESSRQGLTPMHFFLAYESVFAKQLQGFSRPETPEFMQLLPVARGALCYFEADFLEQKSSSRHMFSKENYDHITRGAIHPGLSKSISKLDVNSVISYLGDMAYLSRQPNDNRSQTAASTEQKLILETIHQLLPMSKTENPEAYREIMVLLIRTLMARFSAIFIRDIVDVIHQHFIHSSSLVGRKNHEESILALFMKEGLSPNILNRRGFSLMHYALKDNQGDILALLFRHGATLHMSEKTQPISNPLFMAMQNKKDAVVDVLFAYMSGILIPQTLSASEHDQHIAYTQKCCISDHNFLQLLDICIRRQKYDWAAQLMHIVARSLPTILCNTLQKQSSDIALFVLDYLDDPLPAKKLFRLWEKTPEIFERILTRFEQKLRDHVDENGFSLAHYAAEENRIDLLQRLHQMGWNLNIPSQTSDPVPPIFFACRQNCFESFEYLVVEAGVDVTYRDAYRENLLHKLAFERNLLGMTCLETAHPKWLSRALTMASKYNYTPIHTAAYQDFVAFFQWLMTKPYDINFQGSHPHTLYQMAVANQSVALLDWLYTHPSIPFDRGVLQPLMWPILPANKILCALLNCNKDRLYDLAGVLREGGLVSDNTIHPHAADLIETLPWTEAHRPYIATLKDLLDQKLTFDYRLFEREIEGLTPFLKKLSPEHRLQALTAPCSYGKTFLQKIYDRELLPLLWAFLPPNWVQSEKEDFGFRELWVGPQTSTTLEEIWNSLESILPRAHSLEKTRNGWGTRPAIPTPKALSQAIATDDIAAFVALLGTGLSLSVSALKPIFLAIANHKAIRIMGFVQRVAQTNLSKFTVNMSFNLSSTASSDTSLTSAQMSFLVEAQPNLFEAEPRLLLNYDVFCKVPSIQTKAIEAIVNKAHISQWLLDGTRSGLGMAAYLLAVSTIAPKLNLEHWRIVAHHAMQTGDQALIKLIVSQEPNMKHHFPWWENTLKQHRLALCTLFLDLGISVWSTSLGNACELWENTPRGSYVRMAKEKRVELYGLFAPHIPPTNSHVFQALMADIVQIDAYPVMQFVMRDINSETMPYVKVHFQQFLSPLCEMTDQPQGRQRYTLIKEIEENLQRNGVDLIDIAPEYYQETSTSASWAMRVESRWGTLSSDFFFKEGDLAFVRDLMAFASVSLLQKLLPAMPASWKTQVQENPLLQEAVTNSNKYSLLSAFLDHGFPTKGLVAHLDAWHLPYWDSRFRDLILRRELGLENSEALPPKAGHLFLRNTALTEGERSGVFYLKFTYNRQDWIFAISRDITAAFTNRTQILDWARATLPSDAKAKKLYVCL